MPANKSKTDSANSTVKKKKPAHLFKPGQSGNPSGRPKKSRIFQQKCQEFMESEGWNELIDMAKGNGDKRDKRPALELIASYAYGKPKQGVELTGEDGGMISIELVGNLKELAK